jgi:hypothetical protein
MNDSGVWKWNQEAMLTRSTILSDREHQGKRPDPPKVPRSRCDKPSGRWRVALGPAVGESEGQVGRVDAPVREYVADVKAVSKPVAARGSRVEVLEQGRTQAACTTLCNCLSVDESPTKVTTRTYEDVPPSKFIIPGFMLPLFEPFAVPVAAAL